MFSLKGTLPADSLVPRVRFKLQSVNWPAEDFARFLNLEIEQLHTSAVDDSCQEFVEPVHEVFLNPEGSIAYFLMTQWAI